MMLDRWQVRSWTHTSVLPFASEIVMNVARVSCSRIGRRTSLFSKSTGRSMPAARM
ncbi:hypothetical protein [Polyangium aurulentum]|uniref:hypothetical protein n=1 Tax=Polyangium aurulentum TaxID=2567896 RepID=UPI00146D04C1|nr:hypothetical protein [Polyangium aurulentum]UQA59932.1 hypothetical protein E8A73_005415 [Polyangium aurulentum]